ncbi:MAG: hypothetical protein OEV91_00550 [Desulfobulbaceae bacterium]|nr:hypothetical protein [Desulfobulbaceae bacterium]
MSYSLQETPVMAAGDKKCWEFNNCGEQRKQCAAYPCSGQHCAALAGTAGRCRAGTFDEKKEKCQECAFFYSQHFEDPQRYADRYGWQVAEDLF